MRKRITQFRLQPQLPLLRERRIQNILVEGHQRDLRRGQTVSLQKLSVQGLRSRLSGRPDDRLDVL